MQVVLLGKQYACFLLPADHSFILILVNYKCEGFVAIPGHDGLSVPGPEGLAVLGPGGVG